MSNTKTVVGVDMALVHLKGGGTALVPRGQEIPDVEASEVKRLKENGVFDEPKAAAAPAAPVTADPRVAELEAALAEQAAKTEAAEKALAEAGKQQS